MTHRSVAHMFFSQAEKYGDRTLLRHKEGGVWREQSWRVLAIRVRNAAKGLLELGVPPGARIGLLSENRPEWVVADLATLSVGAADAPMYPTSTPAQCAYILKDCGASVVFASTASQVEKLRRAAADAPGVKVIVSFDRSPAVGDGVITLAELERRGADSGRDEELDARLAAVGRDSLLTLIYTSGTTGDPKGVMLSHANMLDNCAAGAKAVKITEGDTFVSFLPLCHAFERMAGYYSSLLHGMTISYAQSLDTLVDDIADVKPTVLASVPRVYEKVYGRFMEQVATARGAKKALLRRALRVGNRVSLLRQSGKEPRGLLALEYRAVQELVFSKLQNRLGGRIRLLISSGAPLAPEIARFFHAAGMTVLEGYGLTEASPLISVNRLDDYRFGSVGKVVDGVEVKIAPDGEILARGHNVMQGYWNKPAETAEVLLEGGWLATGDIGVLDSTGFLWITDRKKDLIKTAGGKYVAPQEIENLLKLQRWVEQVHVLGDKRPYCVAVIVPKLEALRAWAKEHGLDSATDAALVADPRVDALVRADVEAVNAQLARYQTVKDFVLASEPFSMENGLLTPTLKVKRKAVNARYEREIDALYAAGTDEVRRVAD